MVSPPAARRKIKRRRPGKCFPCPVTPATPPDAHVEGVQPRRGRNRDVAPRGAGARHPQVGQFPAASLLTPEKAKDLAALLATGTWTHDYPITLEEGRKLGLNISSAMPSDVLQLMSLPQPVRRQPSVDIFRSTGVRRSRPDS